MKKILSLLTLLVAVVTGAWADDPDYSNPATVKYGSITFLNVEGTASNRTDTDGNEYLTYGVYYVAKTKSITTWFNSSDNSPASNHESTGYSIENAANYGFYPVSTTAGDINYGGTKCHSTRWRYFYVTGATSVAAIVRDADTKNDKYAQLKIETVAEDGTLGTPVIYGDYGSKSAGYLVDGGSLDPTKYYKISFGSQTTSNCFMYQVRFGKATGPVDPVFSLTSTTIGTDETSQIQVGNKGDLDGITLTGLASSDETVATVSETGLITPIKAGSTTISFTASSAVADKYNATSTPWNATLTVTAPVVATPVITESSVFMDSKTVEITCATDEATIKYSYDNETWSDYTAALNITETTTVYAKAECAGYTDSEVVSATYTKFVPSELVSISEATTWDWTSWGQTLQLTDAGYPTKNDELTYSDIASLTTLTIPSGFNGDALKFKGEYPNNNKRAQNGVWTFNTKVPGTIVVHFADTGNSGTSDNRYLNVNGENTEYYVSRSAEDAAHGKSGATVPSGAIAVSAGDVVITGKKDDNTPIAIRIMKIVFTPATATVTTNKGKWASFTPSWNATLSDGAQAYIITAVSETSVTASTVDVLNAGTGYFVKGAAAETAYTATATADDATATAGNKIVGTTTDITINGEGNTKYVLGTAGEVSGLFKVDSEVTVAAGKAYLDAGTVLSARQLSLNFDEGTTGITTVEEQKGLLDGDFYNVAGQRVAQPTKGLYIVNGKKIILK